MKCYRKPLQVKYIFLLKINTLSYMYIFTYQRISLFRFKPAPDVYLLAAQVENTEVRFCCAVEDSASGVGSASNANMGLIVGYVGANHIPEDRKQLHAEMLMKGLVLFS
jgi:beta-phosphoglucomutase-like phosphatase (HAD superfamily)